MSAGLFDDDLDYVAQALTSGRHAAVVVVHEQQKRGARTGPSAIPPLTPLRGRPGRARTACVSTPAAHREFAAVGLIAGIVSLLVSFAIGLPTGLQILY